MSKKLYRNASIHPDSFDYSNLFLYMNGKKSKVECSECGGVVLAVRFERQRGELNNMFSHQNDILT